MEKIKYLIKFITNLREVLFIVTSVTVFYVSWANQPILTYQILPNWENKLINGIINHEQPNGKKSIILKNKELLTNNAIISSPQKLILYFNYVNDAEKIDIFIKGLNLGLYNLAAAENFQYSEFRLDKINQEISELSILNSQVHSNSGYVVIYGDFHGITEILAKTKSNKPKEFTFDRIGMMHISNKMEKVITDYALLILIILTISSFYISIGRFKK